MIAMSRVYPGSPSGKKRNSHSRINPFSKYKPVRASNESMIPAGDSRNYGIYITRIDNPLKADEYYWTYEAPTGGQTSAYRLGDWNGYRNDASAPISPHIPNEITTEGALMSVHIEKDFSGSRSGMVNLEDLLINDPHLGWVPLTNMYFGVISIYRGIAKVYTTSTKIGANSSQDHMIDIGSNEFTSGQTYKIVSCISTVPASGTNFDKLYSLRYNFPRNISESVKTLTVQSVYAPVKLTDVEWINGRDPNKNEKYWEADGLRFIFESNRYAYKSTYSVTIDGTVLESGSGTEHEIGEFKINKDAGSYEYDSYRDISFWTKYQNTYILMRVYQQTSDTQRTEIFKEKVWIGEGSPK